MRRCSATTFCDGCLDSKLASVGADSAATVTVSRSPAGCMANETLRGRPSNAIDVVSCSNPETLTVSVTAPAGTSLKEKLPSAPVTTLLC